MKVLEYDKRWPDWVNNAVNNIAVDIERITSKVIARGPWGTYHANPGQKWSDSSNLPVMIRNPWIGIYERADPMQSHVWNARFFHRWVYVDKKLRGLTWSWRPKGKDYKHTIILGTKINGRFALTARFFHSDAASARGTNGPNYGQSVGDEFGPA